MQNCILGLFSFYFADQFNVTYLTGAICSPLEFGRRIFLVDMAGNGTTVIVKSQRSAYLNVSVRARGKERRREKMKGWGGAGRREGDSTSE